MKKKQRLVIRTAILIILGAALAYSLYANLTKEKSEVLKLNAEAPDFVLTDMNGQKHKLSDYRGQGVFLNFWGTWCKPCEKEMPYMADQYKVYKDQGVQILAVNVGESEFAVQSFIDKHNLNFPVLIDAKDEVQSAYQVNPLPVTFLIDKEGKVVESITGSLTEEGVQKLMERIKP
ncbi:thiol-disulfide oxidoreductase ResA [Peribacillus saganii]|uniref:Thiol-disulfide oxidoreductase ResA n=1 Tax=Peribacillus saganii TaxID=2303992 RepID=A0A372LMJ0_9BACI|nr:thiol-disulfide oxidoreductase ResA [Peribacillus saganii]RFU67799.1 thiol-disulfide oxidoreductase ResA [Peribacillus saganii]